MVTRLHKEEMTNVGKTITIWKGIKMDPYLTSYIHQKSKWIRELNIRPKTIKFGKKT